ncbi:putative DNA-binding domain-containing protein [uncultured Rheinheimera sp.]|uniref:HvfC family RiPP maturation protein n=1 Tax=uncultured Rheinheimera sp. TaxID=400532 RepID=UPI0025970DF7|nr:putative DNA-binding domain-containing protein [uncultured Rheinheimera sp.]
MKFQQVQQQFVAYLRSPEQNEKPADVTQERLDVYRELLFNNVSGFVSSAFPVLKSLYMEQAWQQKLKLFFSLYRCENPFFLSIAQSFLDFLQKQYQLQNHDPVFMLELAHYEWLELELATCKAQGGPGLTDVKRQALQLSGLVSVQAYQYPVHKICAEFQPTEPEVSFLLIYRNQEDEITFVALNQLTTLLLQLLGQQPGMTLAELVAQMQPYVPQLTADQLFSGAEQMLADFAAKGIVHAFQAR